MTPLAVGLLWTKLELHLVGPHSFPAAWPLMMDLPTAEMTAEVLETCGLLLHILSAFPHLVTLVVRFPAENRMSPSYLHCWNEHHTRPDFHSTTHILTLLPHTSPSISHSNLL
ncbi:hypothetical protein Pelo_10685 [Pelomyxa schiedti]|nr:hypothetical protein Pelo_10685 [Pelomyxa schiedti]